MPPTQGSWGFAKRLSNLSSPPKCTCLAPEAVNPGSIDGLAFPVVVTCAPSRARPPPSLPAELPSRVIVGLAVVAVSQDLTLTAPASVSSPAGLAAMPSALGSDGIQRPSSPRIGHESHWGPAGRLCGGGGRDRAECRGTRALLLFERGLETTATEPAFATAPNAACVDMSNAAGHVGRRLTQRGSMPTCADVAPCPTTVAAPGPGGGGSNARWRRPLLFN
mmetsp:Transcript_93195/g.216597  ORF Transcript_93195/g.216597 Transcript_93195/m.216597 type:complete len:221 (+) Transcript_93195:169-831(+)